MTIPLFAHHETLDVDNIVQYPTLLMCPATYFDVELTHDSNPMEARAAEHFSARRQWVRGEGITQNNALASLYKKLGANPLDMTPNPALRDQIFTTDTSHFIISAQKDADGVIRHKKSFLVYAKMSKQVREAEVVAKKEFYQSALSSKHDALTIHQMQNTIEMGDTRLYPAKGVIFAGLGATADDEGRPIIPRTSEQAHRELEKLTGIPVVTLNLKGDYYHLDTAFCPLPDGHALVYEPAFSPESLAQIKQVLGDENIISLSEEDVKSFASNAFVIHHQIFMPKGISETLQRQLTSIGYDVYLNEIEAPKMSGGGHNCMTDCLSQVMVDGGYVPKSLEAQLVKKQGKVFEVIATPGYRFGEDYAVFAKGETSGRRLPITREGFSHQI